MLVSLSVSGPCDLCTRSRKPAELFGIDIVRHVLLGSVMTILLSVFFSLLNNSVSIFAPFSAGYEVDVNVM